MQENSSEYLDFAVTLAKKSARLLETMQPRAKIKVDKGKGDFALDADIASENLIVSAIRKKYPTHDILTEESKHKHQDSEYLWIIDPLEGTLNYAHKLPLWAVNIGLWKKGEPLVGVVYAPVLKELFSASKGHGAHLNGKQIQVNNDSHLIHSFYSIAVKNTTDLPISRHLMRHLACSGLELAYVACGRFGARIKLHGNDPYGYGAPNIIITEAGGKFTDLHGKPWNLHSDGALVSNGKLHEKLLKIINNTS